jgi:hypothetical protein
MRLRLTVVALVALAFPTAASAQAPRCQDVNPKPPPAGMQPAAQQVSVLDDAVFRFTRGDNRGSSDRTRDLDARPSLPPDARVFAEVAGDLDRADGADSFPEEGILVEPVVSGAGDLKLKICIDPENPETVKPGRYVGSVKIFGPNVVPTVASVEVTLRASALLAVFLLVIGCALGVLGKALADKKATEETLKAAGETDVRFRWRDYFFTGEFIGGLITGLVAAAIAFAQVYLADPDWGEPLDMIALVLAGIASVVSGKTITDWVKPYVPKAA